MKAPVVEWLTSLSGQLGPNYYATPAINQPGFVIIRHKPGPRNPIGTRKDRRWVMPENQAKHVRKFKSVQQIAAEEYRDPVKRAQWQAEYDAWKIKESKKNRLGNSLNGKIVRFLWDYVRIRVQQRETQNPFQPAPIPSQPTT